MGSTSIIIIGAGVAGLSAGCYGRMNGFDTAMFEMHDRPGGVCTSWKRSGYVFDGCIHWLVGSKPGSDFNRVWRELGALDGRRIIDHEEFYRVEGDGGKTLVVYTDAGRLERHMLELAPADSALIRRMASDIRLLSRMSTPLDRPEGPGEALKMLTGVLPFLRPFLRYRGISIQAFAAGFTDPFLREAFPRMFDVPDFPVIAALVTLAWLHKRDAGYPAGGSLEFSRAIERRYLGLGGEVHYGSRVEKVMVEGDRAVGVRLSDGTEHRADVIVSAADGHSTIFDMLEGRYTDEEIRGYYASFPLFPTIVQVSLGVARDFSGEPHAVDFPLAEPFIAGGRAHGRLALNHYCFDPSLAPAGKSVLVVYLASDYDFWKALSLDRKRYEAEKKDVADKVIAALERRFEGITGQVEARDVATPVTYERYTGNWRGSYEGWLLTTGNSRYMVKRMKRELPGLADFHMIGQWLAPGGGLPPAALHGREVIQALCAREKREFRTTVPG